MLMALLGVFVFLLDKAGPRLGGIIIGDLISLIAAFSFAGYNVVNKALLSRYAALVVTAYALTIGGVPVIILALQATFAQDWSRVSRCFWRPNCRNNAAKLWYNWEVNTDASALPGAVTSPRARVRGETVSRVPRIRPQRRSSVEPRTWR
jgi:EamA-like transporter family